MGASQISKARTEKLNDILKNHTLNEMVEFFFNVKNNNGRNETLQKWIDAIKRSDFCGNKWATKIATGKWVVNKYGRKLYYKFGDF